MLIREPITNGEAKQLPCVIKSTDELVGILEKSMREIEENPEKYFITDKGNLRKSFKDSIEVSDLGKYGVSVEGIDSIKVEFSFKPEKINGEVIYTVYSREFLPGGGECSVRVQEHA